ncbi:response regulator transcription factor [Bifidobacterium sp. 82T25]|nr:response regulator transcription factor [Bifidobacterium miconisargentati]
MRSVRVGVVEDDPVACQRILDYLNQYRSETGVEFTVAVFDDGEAIVEQYTPTYDILFLDIEMAHLDGMSAARRIRERDDSVVIVFITAAPQYAINGYQVQALSYLLKPVPYFAFRQELKRSIDMVRRRSDGSLLIEAGGRQIRLELADVVYIESIRHTIIVHTLDGKLSVSGTLKDFEERLAEQDFFRSNSCYLVNLRHVVGVDGQDCVMSNGELLRVSRPRKKAFLTALTNYMGAAGPTARAGIGAGAGGVGTGGVGTGTGETGADERPADGQTAATGTGAA